MVAATRNLRAGRARKNFANGQQVPNKNTQHEIAKNDSASQDESQFEDRGGAG